MSGRRRPVLPGGRVLPGVHGTLVILTATLAASPLGAQQVTFSGQLRPRAETRSPGFAGPSTTFTAMRARLTVRAQPNDRVDFLFQPQDVRVWGSEAHPLFDASADNVDLHQALVRVRDLFDGSTSVSVGRMQTVLGGQRLIGAVDWTPQGQSFDGVRVETTTGRARWTLLGFQVGDTHAPGITTDRYLSGVHATFAETGPGQLDTYWLWDRARAASTSDEHVLGARYVFATDALTGRVEASRSAGSRSGRDLSASMVGARVGVDAVPERLRVTLWYDRLSGDDPDTPGDEAFGTLFATNHKFYGLADVFLNLPVHTAGAGLQDIALKLAGTFEEAARWSVDIHAFRTARDGVLTESRFGEEIDVTLARDLGSGLAVTVGYSRVVQGPALAEAGRLADDMDWAFLMLDAVF